MQLSQSTVSDPTLAALLFPGAAPASATPTAGVASPAAAISFDELFSELGSVAGETVNPTSESSCPPTDAAQVLAAAMAGIALPPPPPTPVAPIGDESNTPASVVLDGTESASVTGDACFASGQSALGNERFGKQPTPAAAPFVPTKQHAQPTLSEARETVLSPANTSELPTAAEPIAFASGTIPNGTGTQQAKSANPAEANVANQTATFPARAASSVESASSSTQPSGVAIIDTDATLRAAIATETNSGGTRTGIQVPDATRVASDAFAGDDISSELEVSTPFTPSDTQPSTPRATAVSAESAGGMREMRDAVTTFAESALPRAVEPAVTRSSALASALSALASAEGAEDPSVALSAETAGSATTSDMSSLANESRFGSSVVTAKSDGTVSSLTAELGRRSFGVPLRANFAAGRNRAGVDRNDAVSNPLKTFVSADGQSVEGDGKALGIGIAQPPAIMPAAYSAPSPHLAFENAGGVVTATNEVAELVSDTTAGEMPTETTATAHAAVEVVLKAVDEVSSREQKSVNLQFAVGENDLSVRVELHGNEVRTTFRTNSSELREALSYEWQTLANSSGDRSTRLAPAVFATSDQNSFNASSGDSSSRQRESHAEQAANSGAFLNFPRTSGQPAGASSNPVSNSSVRVASLTSRHLHTLA